MNFKDLNNEDLLEEFKKVNNEIKLMKDNMDIEYQDLLGFKVIEIIKQLAKRNIPIVDLDANEVMIQYYNDIKQEMKAHRNKNIFLIFLAIITCISIYLQSINVL